MNHCELCKQASLIKDVVSFPDGQHFLNVIPVSFHNEGWELTSCIWDAISQIAHGSGQVLMSGTRDDCIHAAKLLLTLDAIAPALS